MTYSCTAGISPENLLDTDDSLAANDNAEPSGSRAERGRESFRVAGSTLSIVVDAKRLPTPFVVMAATLSGRPSPRPRSRQSAARGVRASTAIRYGVTASNTP